MKYQKYSISCFKNSQERQFDGFKSGSEKNSIFARSSKIINVIGMQQQEWMLITYLYV